MKGLIVSAALVGGAMAQAGAHMPCGGVGWTGETTCVSGYTCVAQKDSYSRCHKVQSGGDAGGVAARQATTMRTSTRRSCRAKTAAPGSSSAAVSSVPTTSAPAEPATSAAAAPVSSAAEAVVSSNAAVTSAAPATSASSASAPAASASASPGKSGKFKWFGANESGAEFGETKLPGTLGTDYTFPNTSTIDTLISQGYNTFRLPFLMERLAPGGLTDKFDADYLSGLTTVIKHITAAGASVAVDPHNYGRFSGSVITDTAGFKTFFTNLAGELKSYDGVIFDTNNEYNSMDQDLVLQLNQAAVDGIRGAGAQNWIWAEGNSWSGAHSWTSVNDNMKGLSDPLNKTVFEMHQYLDSDNSGTSETCSSATAGVERVTDATNWLRSNGKVGVLGEFAGGANDVCKEAVTGLLDYLQENSDVWLGATWWAAGPWWSDYMYSFEPETGAGYVYYNEVLKKYQ